MNLTESQEKIFNKLIQGTNELQVKSPDNFTITIKNKINNGSNEILLKYIEQMTSQIPKLYIFFLSPNFITMSNNDINKLRLGLYPIDNIMKNKEIHKTVFNNFIFENESDIKDKKEKIKKIKELISILREDNNKIMFIINETDTCLDYIDDNALLDILKLSDYTIKAESRPGYHNLLGRAKKYGYYTGKKKSSQGYVYCDEVDDLPSVDILSVRRELLEKAKYNACDISFKTFHVSQKNMWNISSDVLVEMILSKISLEFKQAIIDFFEEDTISDYAMNSELKYIESIKGIIYPYDIFDLIDNTVFNLISKITNINARDNSELVYNLYLSYEFIFVSLLRNVIKNIENNVQFTKAFFSIKTVSSPYNYKQFNYKKNIFNPCMLPDAISIKEQKLIEKLESDKTIIAWYKNDCSLVNHFQIINKSLNEILIPEYIIFYKNKIQIISLRTDENDKKIFDEWLDENISYFTKIIKTQVEFIQL